jgi:hypothetical protein
MAVKSCLAADRSSDHNTFFILWQAVVVGGQLEFAAMIP